MSEREAAARFACFGSSCSALAIGPGRAGGAHDAVALAKRALLGWHDRFSRFAPDSELSQLNADPRARVAVSPLMARFARAVGRAGAISNGLVDATLANAIVDAGYVEDLGAPLDLRTALALAPPRRPASGSRERCWQKIDVDSGVGTIARPPGVALDSGGLAKGLFADVLALALRDHASFAIDCGGDLAIGGAARTIRPIEVRSPFDGSVLHTFALARTGVATSGIGRRSWLDAGGAPAHHLLDPATGRPAFTGVVQATALAPSALLAEIRAKAAVLSGPDRAPVWLADGGVIVFDDGSHRMIAPPPVVGTQELAPFSRRAGAHRLRAAGMGSTQA